MKKMTRETKNNLFTYAGIVVAYIAVQIAISAGMMSSLMEGLLVPVCTYVILAVSLNLTVGILGELSLGHAGFMCVGAFSSAFFSKCTEALRLLELLRGRYRIYAAHALGSGQHRQAG